MRRNTIRSPPPERGTNERSDPFDPNLILNPGKVVEFNGKP